jgi:hypothetical protein
MKWNKLWILEVAIIITSFFIFSNRFSPAVSSDDALSILMTHDYSFPEAIYCWGQNRGGTIVPLVGQLFYKLGFNATWAESLARYLILILGYLSFRRLLHSNISKVALTITFFLPVHFYIGFTIYSWGLMYSFIGLSIWFQNLFENQKGKAKWFFGANSILMAFISIWTMDQAFIPLLIFSAYLIFKYSNNSISWVKESNGYLLGVTGVIIITFFIFYLKSEAVTIDHYNYSKITFNDWEGIKLSIETMYKSSIRAISIGEQFWAGTIYYIALTVSVPIGFILILKNRKPEYVFILLNCLALIGLLVVSKWVLSNYVSGRYFSGIYFCWTFLIILMLDKKLNKNLALSIVLIGILLLGFTNTILHFKTIGTHKLESRYEELTPIEELGQIGIIGNYWYSYGISFRNPDLIIATPHDANETKNAKYVDQVFKQPKIYLVKELWLEEFPEKITQFGRTLKIKGKEIKLAGMTINQYELEH